MFTSARLIIILLIFSLTTSTAFAFFWGNESGYIDPEIRSFEQLEKKKPKKIINFRCDFDKIAKSDFKINTDYCETDNKSRLDYLSNFIAYDFQMLQIESNDFLMNLYNISMKNQPILKRFFSYYSTDEANLKAYIFDNATPSSFVSQYNGRLYFYLSSKDILLRDTVYPTFKVTGITIPEKRYADVINKYGVKFTVHPLTISADYKATWVSAITGTPDYRLAEKLFDDGKKENVLNYFKRVENFIKEYGINYYNFSEDSEKIASQIYPTIFENNGEKTLLPTAKDKEIDGLFTDYLPTYKLLKIDIILRNNKSKTEQLLKTFSRKDIDELYQTDSFLNGIFFDVINSNESQYIIRYTHRASAPKFPMLGATIREGVGFGFIYSSLGYETVTNQEIVNVYNINNMPQACLDIASVPKLLLAKGVTEEDISKLYETFKNRSDECSEIEIMIANIIIINSMKK